MKAISVPISAVIRLGHRLDAMPYVDAVYNIQAAQVRAQAKAAARAAYYKQARRGIAHMHNIQKYRTAMNLDEAVRL